MKTLKELAIECAKLKILKLFDKNGLSSSNFKSGYLEGAIEAQRFIPIEEEEPPLGVECLFQNDKWIHLDLNLKGIRVGYRCDLSGYVSAYFCSQHDCYMTRYADEDNENFELSKAEDQIPTHWRPYERL